VGGITLAARRVGFLGQGCVSLTQKSKDDRLCATRRGDEGILENACGGRVLAGIDAFAGIGDRRGHIVIERGCGRGQSAHHSEADQHR
jgi:hypothetical protein